MRKLVLSCLRKHFLSELMRAQSGSSQARGWQEKGWRQILKFLPLKRFINELSVFSFKLQIKNFWLGF